MKAITIELGGRHYLSGGTYFWVTVITDDTAYEDIYFDALDSGLKPFVDTMYDLYGPPMSVPHRNPSKDPTLSGVFVRLSADSNDEELAEYVKTL